jgi:squalene-hopene/tetraprenyl-beta-curcumene cyclase
MVGALIVLAGLLALAGVRAAEDKTGWNAHAAEAYLDERAKTWFDFSGAYRGTEATRTNCVSCHTALPYALARPALRRLAGATAPTEFEDKLLGQVKRRVEHWDALDTPAWTLMYDFNDDKKKESWGTEAVIDALVLAQDDRQASRTAPSDATRQAFEHLWQRQIREGDQAGSWDWLDFGYEPWEAGGARYYGAALAAIAVGTAPGYYAPTRSVALDESVQRMRTYLHDRRAGQNLFNLAWALWAATQLEGTLTAEEKQTIRDQLLASSARTAAGRWPRSASTPGRTRRRWTPARTATRPAWCCTSCRRRAWRKMMRGSPGASPGCGRTRPRRGRGRAPRSTSSATRPATPASSCPTPPPRSRCWR